MTDTRTLEGLVAKWRADAKRWRADDETPYACEWADTIEECAKELEALIVAPSLTVAGAWCPHCGLVGQHRPDCEREKFTRLAAQTT